MTTPPQPTTPLPPPAALAVDIENDGRLDGAVEALRRLTAPLGETPAGQLLRGNWLGHALHPVLTDLPLGLWTSASVLDAVGGQESRTAARRLVGLGLLSVAPTAASGWAEWHRTSPGEQRVGVVHAVLNVAGVACYAGSWAARRADRHRLGVTLALTGAGFSGVAGYLGGHLSAARKVSSRHPAFDAPTDAASASDTPIRKGPAMAPAPHTGDDVLAAVVRQHAHLRATIDRVAGDVRGGDASGLSELFRLLAVHQAVEDVVVAPLTAASSAGSAQLGLPGDPSALELQAANLEALTPGDAAHTSQLAALEDTLEHHLGADEVQEVAATVRALDEGSATRIVEAIEGIEAGSHSWTGSFADLLDTARGELRRDLA